MIHAELVPFYEAGQVVQIGAVLTQPYCVLELDSETVAYADLGAPDEWSEQVCDDGYAEMLALLLRSYRGRLLPDVRELRTGLVVEITAPDAEDQIRAFLELYTTIFEL